MESLQDMFGLGQRLFRQEMIDGLDKNSLKIDYSKADELFAPFEKTSKEYLINALYGEKD